MNEKFRFYKTYIQQPIIMIFFSRFVDEMRSRLIIKEKKRRVKVLKATFCGSCLPGRKSPKW